MEHQDSSIGLRGLASPAERFDTRRCCAQNDELEGPQVILRHTPSCKLAGISGCIGGTATVSKCCTINTALSTMCFSPSKRVGAVQDFPSTLWPQRPQSASRSTWSGVRHHVSNVSGRLADEQVEPAARLCAHAGRAGERDGAGRLVALPD